VLDGAGLPDGAGEGVEAELDGAELEGAGIAGVGLAGAGVPAAGGAGAGDCAGAPAMPKAITATGTNARARRKGRRRFIGHSPRSCSWSCSWRLVHGRLVYGRLIHRRLVHRPVRDARPALNWDKVAKSASRKRDMLTCSLALRPITDISWAFPLGKGLRHGFSTLRRLWAQRLRVGGTRAILVLIESKPGSILLF